MVIDNELYSNKTVNYIINPVQLNHTSSVYQLCILNTNYTVNKHIDMLDKNIVSVKDIMFGSTSYISAHKYN